MSAGMSGNHRTRLPRGFVRASEAAALLRCSQRRIYALVERGHCPGGLYEPASTTTGRTWCAVPETWVWQFRERRPVELFGGSPNMVPWAPGCSPKLPEAPPPPPAPPDRTGATLEHLVRLLENSQPAFVGLREVQAMLREVGPLRSEVHMLRAELKQIHLLLMDRATSPGETRQ